MGIRLVDEALERGETVRVMPDFEVAQHIGIRQPRAVWTPRVGDVERPKREMRAMERLGQPHQARIRWPQLDR